MTKPLTSITRARAISFSLTLVGLAIMIFTNRWWPWIMLVIGVPLALRQYLLGRYYDMLVSLVVFVGVFVTLQFDISWGILLPVIFLVGAIYVLFREFVYNRPTYEDEEESHNVEIEIDSEEKHHEK
jgi:predicted membrane protein